MAWLRSVLFGLGGMDELDGIKFLTEVGSIETYKDRHPPLLHGLGSFAGDYTIRLKPIPVPHAVHVARRSTTCNVKQRFISLPLTE